MCMFFSKASKQNLFNFFELLSQYKNIKRLSSCQSIQTLKTFINKSAHSVGLSRKQLLINSRLKWSFIFSFQILESVWSVVVFFPRLLSAISSSQVCVFVVKFFSSLSFCFVYFISRDHT